MLAIKLKRIGKRRQPSYRVVVTEKRSKLRGRYVEDLGWFNPMQQKDNFNFFSDRVMYWISQGAKPTDTVHNLLVRAGVLKAPKIPVHKMPKKTEASSEAATTAPGSASSEKAS